MLPTPPIPPNPYLMQRLPPGTLHGQHPLMLPGFPPVVVNKRDLPDDSRNTVERSQDTRSKEPHKDSHHRETSRPHKEIESSRSKTKREHKSRSSDHREKD